MRRLMILGAALGVLGVLAGGCSDSESDGGATADEAELPESLCEQVGAEDLEKWSGAPRTVKEPRTAVGYTICGTELGADGLGIDWRFTEVGDGGDGTLDEIVEARASAGARTRPIIVAGKTRGFAFSDDSGTGPSFVVAIEYGEDAALLVTTSLTMDTDPAAGKVRAKPAVLEPLATKIAEHYAQAR